MTKTQNSIPEIRPPVGASEIAPKWEESASAKGKATSSGKSEPKGGKEEDWGGGAVEIHLLLTCFPLPTRF